MHTTITPTNDRAFAAVTVFLLGCLIVSGFNPHDRATWAMEVAPVIVVLPLLWATRRRFPLTRLLLVGIAAHGLVLIAGGAYSYARVPLGFALQDWLSLDRNPYDKIGHFFQGLVPALVAREILLRGNHVRGPRMLAFLVMCVVLAFSASYEMVEWCAALVMGQGADEFLGTQGDPWDTQSDMLFALLGAVVMLVLLPRWHDRQLAGLSAAAAACRQ